MNRWDKHQLLPDQKQLVVTFFKEILPPARTSRWNRNNELRTICKALDKWFMRYYRFHVPLNEFAICVEEMAQLGYCFKPMWDDYDPETKTSRPVEVDPAQDDSGVDGIDDDGWQWAEAPYAKQKASYLFINIHSPTIAQLRRLTTTLPPNTNPEKHMDLVPLQEKLRDFQIRHLAVL